MFRKIITATCCLALLLSTAAYSQQSKDITAAGGILKVNTKDGAPLTDHPGGEAPPMVIDNNSNSKFLIFNFNNYKPVRIIFQPNNLAIVDQYSLTSANDAPDRDPAAWVLEGSDDQGTWTVLDTRTGEAFGSRFQTKTYNFTNLKAYKFYAFRIDNNNGGGLFQLAEWRLYKREGPPPPDNFKAKAISKTSIELTWVNNATNALKLVIQRSLDGVVFDSLTAVAPTVTSYIDEGLEEGKGYYYRLFVTSNTVNSDFSLIAGALTDTDESGPPRPVAMNVITPNGDGINDRWVITNLNFYPRHDLKIFDRAGRTVYETRDYSNDWDGSFNGKVAPEGTYYYIIKFWPGIPDLKGTITLIRNRR